MRGIVIKLPLVFCFLFLGHLLFAQQLPQHITNFTPREYGHTNSLYTQSVAEDNNGLIYVGSVYGILQYDGVNWRKIHVESILVTSLSLIDEIVYVGCQGNFGYLEADVKGRLHFVSLLNLIAGDTTSFSAIWKIFPWNNRIVFQSEEALYIYDNKHVQTVMPRTSFHLAFVADGRLLVRERSFGLMEYNGESMQAVDGGEIFADASIFAILPYREKTHLVVSSDKGLMIWGEQGFEKSKQEDKLVEALKNASVIGAKCLSDGYYALNSIANGVFILDTSLSLAAHYSLHSGLRSAEVRDMIQDHRGNLWLATQKGVNRLQYTSPVSFFSENRGLFGSVQSLSTAGHTILAGTSEGLFSYNTQKAGAFTEAPEIKSCVWSMAATPHGHWLATESGLWVRRNETYSSVSQSPAYAVVCIEELQQVVAACKDGLFFYDAVTQRPIKSLTDVKSDACGMVYRMLDKDVCELWIGSRSRGVWRIETGRNTAAVYEHYAGMEDGLPQNWVCAFKIGEKTVFTTESGLLRFVSPKEILELYGETVSNTKDIRGYFDVFSYPKNLNGRTITALHSLGDSLYASLDFSLNLISVHDSMASDDRFKTIGIGRINTIDSWNTMLLVGGDEGLCVIDLLKSSTLHPPPNLLFRILHTNTDTLWYGDIPDPGRRIELPYYQNFLKVHLASAFFDNNLKALYAWRMEGFGGEYTNWSDNPVIVFSNLKEGEYKLFFIAKDINDALSEELVLHLRILPPWYRSAWAYIVYGILLILAVILIVQLNIRRLKEKNRKLEEIVKVRTLEVVEKKEQIEIQKNRIEEILTHVQSSINYARRIQQALLPSEELIRNNLNEYFILFKPRDVVSGDFYWASRQGSKLVITAADCTGHGVPGAFMSVLGMSLLNEIVESKGITEPAQILNILRKGVITALGQKGSLDEQKDGMDISLACIDFETNVLQWAGANNPLWIVTKTDENVELIEIKADKMPVAIHDRMPPFTNHSIELCASDRLFMFSDGFADQFGGEQNKKFMSRNFKQLLVNNNSLRMSELNCLLEESFSKWKGENHQVDDVVVIGIEI